MIDTLKLLVSEYEITRESSLQIQPATYRVSTGEGEPVSEFPLFRDITGRLYRGSKAYLNNDKFNLTIQPFSKARNGTCCFVSFSVPKVHSGENNFYSVGQDGSRAAIQLIEQELSQAGFKTRLEEAHISRVDTFKNIETEEPFSSYYSLLSLLRARRGIQRGYGTTFLLHNTQQEFCVYDKLAEMKAKGMDISHFPGQAMRFEHRLLNKAKCEKVYGFTKVQDLFSGGYEKMKACQVQEWRKSLFSYEVEDIILLGSKQLEQELRIYQERYNRNYFEHYLKDYGAYRLAAEAGVEVVSRALRSLEANRLKVYRAEKKLIECKKSIELMREEPGSNKTMAALYQELKEKVCLN